MKTQEFKGLLPLDRINQGIKYQWRVRDSQPMGVNKMETKSRYEVIADLEEQKRNLIRERDNMPDQVREKNIQIRNHKRHLEDMEEDLTEFMKRLEERKETLNELIKGVEESLKRFTEMQSGSQKK